MENISEVIWEVIYVILFALGISFIFGLFNMMGNSGDIVNKEVRTKSDITEDNTGYTGYNIINGTSVFYDIIDTAEAIRENEDTVYKVIVVNSETSVKEIGQDVILNAENGNSAVLLDAIEHLGGYYRKTYSQDSNGVISKVTYTYVGMNEAAAKGNE